MNESVVCPKCGALGMRPNDSVTIICPRCQVPMAPSPSTDDNSVRELAEELGLSLDERRSSEVIHLAGERLRHYRQILGACDPYSNEDEDAWKRDIVSVALEPGYDRQKVETFIESLDDVIDVFDILHLNWHTTP